MTDAAPSFPSIPDDAAIAALRRRGVTLAPTDHWTDLWQEEHHRAFTVARSAGFDILSDVHAAMERAMTEGWTFARFRAELEPVLRRKGWWGRQTRVDPVTGRKEVVELGSARRLKLMLDVNLRVAAAQGDWEHHQAVRDAFPWLRYTAILDAETRPEHAAWHGVILPADHPWWKTHYPPNGWKCRCKAMSVGPVDLEAEGWTVTESPPDEGTVPWVHPRTGEIRHVPRGIDPGWDYNPGDTGAAAHAAKLAMDKLAFLPPRMGASAVTALAFAYPQVERELASWIESVAAAAERGDFRPTGARRVVGCLDDAALAFLEERAGMSPESAAITIEDGEILHLVRTAKKERGNALTTEEASRLPSLLRSPQAVYWDRGLSKSGEKEREPGLIYIWDAGDHGDGKIIVRVNFKAKLREEGKQGRKTISTNSIRSARTGLRAEDMNEEGGYILIHRKP